MPTNWEYRRLINLLVKGRVLKVSSAAQRCAMPSIFCGSCVQRGSIDTPCLRVWTRPRSVCCVAIETISLTQAVSDRAEILSFQVVSSFLSRSKGEVIRRENLIISGITVTLFQPSNVDFWSVVSQFLREQTHTHRERERERERDCAKTIPASLSVAGAQVATRNFSYREWRHQCSGADPMHFFHTLRTVTAAESLS